MNYKSCTEYNDINVDFDFDLNNYTFKELLKLFQINKLDTQTLRIAYKFAMMTHPDKSKLHKKYFIFFSKAFKLLKQVYDSNNRNSLTTAYVETEYEITKNNIEKFKNQDNFSGHFNTLFNSLDKNEHDEENFGYAEWLKQNKQDSHSIHSLNQLHEYIENKKELVRYQKTQWENVSNCHYSLSRKKPDNYDAEIFAKLPYQDLKKACIDIIPSTQKQNRENISYDNYVLSRDKDMNNYKDNSESYLKHRQEQEYEDNMHTLFELSKQMENTKKNQKIWSSYIMRIKNDF